jgi:hypothetical protein
MLQLRWHSTLRERRHIAALGHRDHDFIGGAVTVVIIAETIAQPRGFDADNRICF